MTSVPWVYVLHAGEPLGQTLQGVYASRCAAHAAVKQMNPEWELRHIGSDREGTSRGELHPPADLPKPWPFPIVWSVSMHKVAA